MSPQRPPALRGRVLFVQERLGTKLKILNTLFLGRQRKKVRFVRDLVRCTSDPNFASMKKHFWELISAD